MLGWFSRAHRITQGEDPAGDAATYSTVVTAFPVLLMDRMEAIWFPRSVWTARLHVYMS